MIARGGVDKAWDMAKESVHGERAGK